MPTPTLKTPSVATPLIFSNKTNIAVVTLLVVASFLLGSLWTEVRYLKKGIPSSGSATPEVGGSQPTTPPLGNAKNLKPLSKEDHVRGNKDARVLLFEYSDLECPFCKQFHPTAKRAVDEYKGQVAWVFRHFPLDNLHSKARNEAEAAECAGLLGGTDGFWKFVDKVYEVTPANNGLDPAQLPIIATQIGLKESAFSSCLSDRKFKKVVEDDYQSGLKAGISGTPGNILLDTKTGKTGVVPGAVPYDQLKQAIDGLLSGS